MNTLTLSDIRQALIQDYYIADYTGIFVQRNNHDIPGHMVTKFNNASIRSVDIQCHEVCYKIAYQFESLFVANYMYLATLSICSEEWRKGYYRINDAGRVIDFLRPTDEIPCDLGLKITLESRPAIYLCCLGSGLVHWRIEFGSGYSEKFNLNYHGSVLDCMLEGSNG